MSLARKPPNGFKKPKGTAPTLELTHNLHQKIAIARRKVEADMGENKTFQKKLPRC